ncbi:dihydrofolate reductase [Persicirhabdus sediminis]|uniref:Dihydrofolate reductase n=1 Tax=Persicirhabdus sediminis TaxID=454144 RepID=A0A8J7SL23_9BACT|nr:dihydrofolate reductase [Persicirhabdus sediminis]MBK1792101.1 dihydrofolate reductase [Persicirhabdus sediminis]
MKLSAIVAMTPERVIGLNGDMPWHLPEDLKLFRRHTTGHPIVMGRKTWDSIGRPLPKRQNIVITRDTSWSADGATVIHSPAQLEKLDLLDDHVFIIGGAQIYQLFLDQLDDILVSHIHASYDGDTWFPDFIQQFPEYQIVEEFEKFELRHYTRAE